MNPSEIITEFRKKYEGCYMHVQMPDSTEDNLFMLSSVTQERFSNTAVLQLQSEEFGKIQLNMGTAHTLKFRFPKVGAFQNGADACLFYRVPRRQWRRGLCSDNAVIKPVWELLVGGSRGLGDFNFATVEAAFKGTHFTYSEAIKMLGSGKYRSVALANCFSVVLNTSVEPAYLLLYRATVIAKLNEAGEIVNLLEPTFSPQIKHILKS